MTAGLAYRVEVLGGGLRGVKPEQLEALLNEVAADGWQLHGLSHQPNSNRVWVVLAMDRAEERQALRRKKGWSLDWG